MFMSPVQYNSARMSATPSPQLVLLKPLWATGYAKETNKKQDLASMM